MTRPQFSLRALLVAMLVVAAFFGGIQFGAKRERERLIDELAEKDYLISKYHNRTLVNRLWKLPQMVIEEAEPLAGINGSSWAEDK